MIERATGVAPSLEKGAAGQFDVVVDGTVVASRGGGFLAKAFGGGWPEPDDVVAAVKARLAAAR